MNKHLDRIKIFTVILVISLPVYSGTITFGSGGGDSKIEIRNSTDHRLEVVGWMVDRNGEILENAAVFNLDVDPHENASSGVFLSSTFKTSYCPKQQIRLEACPVNKHGYPF